MCPEEPANHLPCPPLKRLYNFQRTVCRPGRVVTVSSAAHLFGKINFGDLQYSKSYSAWGAYGQSKLANILFTYELARRLPSHLTANTLHPGVVATELQRWAASAIIAPALEEMAVQERPG